MNNLSSYCGLVDAKIRASDKDLHVTNRTTFMSNFTIKMALLSLEQLLRGVFVIAIPPTMDLGTSEEYWHNLVG